MCSRRVCLGTGETTTRQKCKHCDIGISSLPRIVLEEGLQAIDTLRISRAKRIYMTECVMKKQEYSIKKCSELLAYSGEYVDRVPIIASVECGWQSVEITPAKNDSSVYMSKRR